MLITRATSAQDLSLRAVYNALGGVMAPIWVAHEGGDDRYMKIFNDNVGVR